MKILALDFSSPQRSVAVACGCAHIREVIETSVGNTMQPFRMIGTALDEAGIGRDEIECIVVGLGPGSYTGIRAGIALAQGWQLARLVLLSGVSSVEAIAAQARTEGLRGRINIVVDAQRGEFYQATWELADGAQREVEALHIVGRDVVQERMDAGEAIVGPQVTKWFPAGRLVFPRAAMLASLVAGRPDPGSGDSLEPIYLRETTFVKAPPARVF